MWHHPLFSSSTSNATEVQPFVNALYAAHADLILLGHDHIYERFAPLGPTGASIRTACATSRVGTGGSSHHSVGTVKTGSEIRNVSTYGVLRLVLHPASYDWEFLPIAGMSFTDSGTQAIVGANAPPSATVALTPTTAGTTNADRHRHQVRSGAVRSA